ncbi:MAG TPA: trigger factor [Candidatus Polarisedimenticolaceae bacterium]|nr:trigger factor [Candidatus Polarisedimenticolaceae bacterium]
MKVDLTEQSPVKKVLAFEIDADEMAKETKSVLRGYASKARIPGFRPGKAPLSVIHAKFKKEVEGDVRERVMSRSFHRAAEEHGLRPLGDPVVDEVRAEDGEPFRFKLTVEVLPEIEVKNYRGIEARRESRPVGEREVADALEELRQSRTQFVTEEGRAAMTGDVISCDVRGVPDGGQPFERERTLVEVGAPANPPAFNERLEGARAGEKLSFAVDYPKEYENPDLAGKTVRFEITVHEVKVRQVPQLDDEFAKDLGDFDDLAALTARVRSDLEQRRSREVEGKLRQTLLDKVLLENPMVLPDVLVDSEIRQRLEELIRRLYLQGVDPEKVEIDWKRLRDDQEAPARKSVHARLVLDAIARAEGLAVTPEEIDDRIRNDARSVGESHDQFKKRLREHGGTEVIRTQILREKSLDLLTAVANIQSEE